VPDKERLINGSELENSVHAGLQRYENKKNSHPELLSNCMQNSQYFFKINAETTVQ